MRTAAGAARGDEAQTIVSIGKPNKLAAGLRDAQQILGAGGNNVIYKAVFNLRGDDGVSTGGLAIDTILGRAGSTPTRFRTFQVCPMSAFGGKAKHMLNEVLPLSACWGKRTQSGRWRQFSILCEIGRIGTTFSVDIILLPAIIVLEETVKIFTPRGHLLGPKSVVLVDV